MKAYIITLTTHPKSTAAAKRCIGSANIPISIFDAVTEEDAVLNNEEQNHYEMQNEDLDFAVFGEEYNQKFLAELERIKAEKAQLIKDKKIRKEKPLPPITEDEIPFELPQGWVWVYVTDICDVYTGNSINKAEKEAKYTIEQPGLNYIGTKDVEFNMAGINYETGVIIPHKETLSKFRVAPSESVLICIEGGSSGKKIVIIDRKICFGNKLLASVPYLKILGKYIYYYYNSPAFASEFQLQSKGLRGGVSTNSFKQIKIPIPPEEELFIITQKIEVLLIKCHALEQEIKTSEANAQMLMQAVLKEAFEGKQEVVEV